MQIQTLHISVHENLLITQLLWERPQWYLPIFFLNKGTSSAKKRRSGPKSMIELYENPLRRSKRTYLSDASLLQYARRHLRIFL